MTKLKTMLGLGVISAAAICAFAVQGASATTAYLCSKTPTTKVFSDAHCTNKEGTLAYAHKEIPPLTKNQVGEGKATPITLTNVTTGEATSIARVKSVQSGITLELSATGVHGEGFLENTEEGGEMFAHGTATVRFTGVEVTLPKGIGCKVKEGEFETKTLTGTTKGLPLGQVKFAPLEGGILAEFTIEGCSVPELNHLYMETGSLIGSASGATTTFTHLSTTTQGTFKLFGQKAGFDGTITIKDTTTGEGIALT